MKVIIEKVRESKTSPKGKEFYLPHRPVIQESAETIKIRIVYDASAKPNKDSVSLNECLKTGPTAKFTAGYSYKITF